MSDFTDSDRRIQIRVAPDAVVKYLTDPAMGSKLRLALNGKIEIPPVLEYLLNDATKSKRVVALLQIMFSYIDDFERNNPEGSSALEKATQEVAKKAEAGNQPSGKSSARSRPTMTSNDLANFK